MRYCGFVDGEQQDGQDAGKLVACRIDAELFGWVVLVDDDAVELSFDETAGVMQQQWSTECDDVAA